MRAAHPLSSFPYWAAARGNVGPRGGRFPGKRRLAAGQGPLGRELGGAFLEERAHSLLLAGGLEEPPPELSFVLETGETAGVGRMVDEVLGRGQRLGRFLRQGGREVDRGLQEFGRRNDAVEEAVLERLAGRALVRRS